MFTGSTGLQDTSTLASLGDAPPSSAFPALSDEDLVARALKGDESAFAVLVTRYSARVYRLASRFTGGGANAEEVLQDTFLRVYRKLDSFRGDAKFSTWLYRIATNCALMLLRKNQQRRTESLDAYLPDFTETGYLARTDLDYGKVARADELLEREQLVKIVLLGLQELPDIYQTVFVLRDLEELSTEETAKVLRLAPGTVRQRLHRARLMLRAHLAQATGEKV